MKLELREKERKVVEWALIHYLETIERAQRSSIDDLEWETLEEDNIITRVILKQIKNEKSN